MRETNSAAKSWRDRWTCEKRLSSGNQGVAMRAHDASGTIAFVKALRTEDQRDSTKRARLHREVTSLKTVDIPEIPRLIESNSAHFEDRAFELYIATEFIDGPTLQRYVEDGLVSANLAATLTMSLCETLELAHAHGIYHRDIKPDNIIIASRNGEIKPILCDFGMATIKDFDEGFKTSIGVEVGNRFLRLPEFTAGFDTKDDARSDVTFCVGLFFYMLTGVKPRALMDGWTRLPHQRGEAPKKLASVDLHKDRLFALFDRGFQEAISRRFQSAEEFKGVLRQLALPKPTQPSSEPITMANVLERIGTSSERGKAEQLEAMERCYLSVSRIASAIARESHDLLEVIRGGRKSSSNGIVGDIGLRQKTNHAVSFDASLTVRISGSEILLSFEGPGVPRKELRLQLTAAELSETDTLAVKNFYARGLDVASDPEQRASVAQARTVILAVARGRAESMVNGMLDAVSQFVKDTDSGIIETLGSKRTQKPRTYDRAVTAHGYMTGRLGHDGYYVHFMCSASVRLATHPADIADMLVGQSVDVRLTKAVSGHGITERIGHGGRSTKPFIPSKDELQRILTNGLARAASEFGS